MSYFLHVFVIIYSSRSATEMSRFILYFAKYMLSFRIRALTNPGAVAAVVVAAVV